MAYWDGPWASEDGGAARVQAASGRAPAGALSVVSRDAPGAHMVIVRAVDEVYLYGSTFGAGSTAWVERLDATTLEPIARVDDLAGGPWWPGGIAAHANGSLHVVHGRWAHRLSVDLRPQAARELPQDRAYNSFVVLPDGHLVTKDLVMDGSAPSRLVVLDPDSLEIVAAEVAAPEASIARLSADHDVVYVVGDHSVFRYQWDGRRLALDADWSFRYRTAADQSYGWDPVIAGGHVWFMDNGAHRYAGTMRDRGVASGPVHLVRVAVDDARDHELVEISGLAGWRGDESAAVRRNVAHRSRVRLGERSTRRVPVRRRTRTALARRPRYGRTPRVVSGRRNARRLRPSRDRGPRLPRPRDGRGARPRADG